MARISGVDLPKNKKLEIALTYVYGIGWTLAQKLLESTQVDPKKYVKDLNETEILKLREEISKLKVEGDLRRDVSLNIRRLKDINCYRGQRHKRNLPVRGQRTHTNARTKKGKRIAIANKKKVTK